MELAIPPRRMARFFISVAYKSTAFATTKNEKPVSSWMKRVPFVTSSGEMSNFLMEDLELVLQFETIDKCEVSMKLEA
ncbi:hypothetical protein [Fluviicola sp.]|uniref:hypothetical protein n=1 Tax=Fluviicola sp. TaxID=1917219 RepID=UPI003D269EEA